jgi:hypothetical protein
MPSLSEMSDKSFLLDSGETPSATNYDDAVRQFLASPAAEDWKSSNSPVARALFPCSSPVPEDILVEKLKAEGLCVAYVKASEEFPSGFMVTQVGYDLSHHIAAAYVTAGCVPPYQTLHDALQRHPNSSMAGDLLKAARQHVDHCQSVIEAFEDILERDADLRVGGP